MLKFFKSLFDENKKTLNTYKVQVDHTNSLEKQYKKLKDADIAAKTSEFKVRVSRGETLDDILPEAFALAKEAARRVLGLSMHDVQLLAAITFHNGNVAEQKTGEGKTLSAVPTLYLNALTGKGVHLVTVNDYLARLGAGWMGPVFEMLNLSVGVIFSGKGNQPAVIYDTEHTDSDEHDERLRHFKPVERKQAYEADITYGTNNEFGFDYLRDNMVQRQDNMVQRGHHFAIVDEVDSILIDEARTPLIISAPDTEPTEKYYTFSGLIKELSPDTDYTIDEKSKSASLTEHGITKLEKKLKIDNLYEKDFETIHHIENALRAKSLYLKDKDYVVQEDQVIIVDEFTGRLMYGRRWSDGLHQAVEAKEGVNIQQESKTLATISFQNYFRMYEKLAGMTGTAATEAEEFNRIYGLDVIVIPTHKPITRIDHGDVIYKTMRAKYAAIAEEVKTLSEKGQPVLIGTTSIEKNDLVASFLKRKRIPFNILNAKNHAKEAMVIADAGKPGAVTVATNIAGRGVDIVLGGSPPDDANYKTKNALKKAREEWQANHNAVLASGGLFVIGTERHESRRIDNQLRGRSGRQGDVGGSRFYVSLEDDIMRIFGGEQVSRFMTMFRLPEDVPLEHKMVGRAIEQAQVKVEGFHFDSRKRVVEYDDVMNKQRGIIYGRRHKILKMVSEIEEESKATSSKDTLDSSLHKQIMGNIEADIENIVTMYAPQGYTDTEYEQIIREFSNIVPFDIDSQNHIQKEIEKLKHAEKISIHLQDIFHKVWKSREDSVGKSQLHQIEVFVTLRTIDKLWMEHIDNMQNLREGIGLRGYGQRDPLVEYKQEAFTMFERLLANIDYEINRHVMRVQVAQRTAAPMQVIAQHPHAQTPGVTTQKPSKKPQTVRRHPQNSSAQKQDDKTKKKLGRNDPCWCGSGKKWKKCHWPDLS